jgi:hypothetical protein
MSVWVLLALLAVGPSAPDPGLTPGVVRPLSLSQLCDTRWGRDRRHVTDAMRRTVARRYGVPWAKHRLYEFDHLIPRELGGADDVRNLWPQILDPDARLKDREENRLHRAVCAGQLALSSAQDHMRTWGRAR